MKKEITSQDQELAQFGYKLAAALEESLRMTFLDTQETNKFSPQVFNIFSIESIEKNVDNSMATDGVFYLSSDTKGRNYYVDTHIGLIYVLCDGIYSVVAHSCTSKQYDVFDAAYLRRCILNPDYRNPLLLSSGVNGYKEITSLDYMGYKLKDIFFASIPEYTVSTKKELKELISDLTSLLSQSKFFRKLWFRGQRKEYTITRSKETLRKLGLPLSFEIMPALVPSLGRDIEHKNFDEICNLNRYWITAFKIWLLSQTPNVASDFKVGAPLYNRLIKSLEPSKMVNFLYECPFDIEEYIFYQSRNDILANLLAMQQYGGLTSMLDITDDLDVALFFTQSFLNPKTQKYELCGPGPENVIYLMAQCRGTSTVNLSQDMFDSIPYDGRFAVPPRIANQKCGLLRGADIYGKNTYAYRTISKVHLRGSEMLTTKTVDDMFPDSEIDSLYKTYANAFPKLHGLYG